VGDQVGKKGQSLGLGVLSIYGRGWGIFRHRRGRGLGGGRRRIFRGLGVLGRRRGIFRVHGGRGFGSRRLAGVIRVGNAVLGILESGGVAVSVALLFALGVSLLDADLGTKGLALLKAALELSIGGIALGWRFGGLHHWILNRRRGGRGRQLLGKTRDCQKYAKARGQ
jgi:hypothetical protein